MKAIFVTWSVQLPVNDIGIPILDKQILVCPNLFVSKFYSLVNAVPVFLIISGAKYEHNNEKIKSKCNIHLPWTPQS